MQEENGNFQTDPKIQNENDVAPDWQDAAVNSETTKNSPFDNSASRDAEEVVDENDVVPDWQDAAVNSETTKNSPFDNSASRDAEEVVDENDVAPDWQDAAFNSKTTKNSPFDNSASRDTEEVVDDIKTVDENNRAILGQFKENEKQNREFKPKVFWAVCIFIMLQLIVMTVIILIVVIGLVVGNERLWFIHKIDSSICQDLFSFLKYYISATIVELLAMLFFIVKRVFENNVSKMFETNQNRSKNNNEKVKK